MTQPLLRPLEQTDPAAVRLVRSASYAEPDRTNHLAVGQPRPSPMLGPIVLACDGAYGMPLATTLRSIVESNPGSWPLEFHVLASGVPERTRTRVMTSLPRGSASLRWVSINLDLFEGFSTAPYISTMTYARFLIQRVFPETVSRVLYLDADLLVLDDLSPLWQTDLQGAVIGAVTDGLDALIKTGWPGLEAVPRVTEYFNAGILLINLDRWRSERIAEKALAYLVQHPDSPFSDQDALNVACDGRWHCLDPRWNFQEHLHHKIAEMTAAERPRIVHFVTTAKPWNPTSLSSNAAFYDAFRRRTRFARSAGDIAWDMARRAWSQLKRRAQNRQRWRHLSPRSPDEPLPPTGG